MVASTKSFDAGGFRYVLTHAPGRITLQVAARLGNASAALFDGLAHGKGGQRLANAAVYLMSSPDLGPTLMYVVDSLSKFTQVQNLEAGTTATLADCYDAHFAGRLKDQAKWIEEAIDFECGDFLGELVEKFLAALAGPKADSSVSTSPKGAGTTGGSGGSSSPQISG